MKIEQIVFVAFLMAIVCYVGEMVWFIQSIKKNKKRLEIAKEKQWVVQPQVVKSNMVDKATSKEFQDERTRTMRETTYEYSINGRKKRFKVTTSTIGKEIKEIYYDAENNYKVLNLSNEKPIKIMLLLPIIVFVGIILIGKFIFGV